MGRTVKRPFPAWAFTLLVAAGLGAVVLGGGGRIAMHVIARETTGSGSFTLGGTLTVVLLGVASGLLGGLILMAARRFFHRWSPIPSILYWGLLLGLTLRGIKPVDELRLAVFLPVVVVFGVGLQWMTFRWRDQGSGISGQGLHI
jgi:hypothetical protein